MPNYKTYEAPTLKEAKEMAIKEWGVGITILGERSLEKKVWRRFKFVKENWVELRVAVYAKKNDDRSSYSSESQQSKKNISAAISPAEKPKQAYTLAANFKQFTATATKPANQMAPTNEQPLEGGKNYTNFNKEYGAEYGAEMFTPKQKKPANNYSSLLQRKYTEMMLVQKQQKNASVRHRPLLHSPAKIEDVYMQSASLQAQAIKTDTASYKKSKAANPAASFNLKANSKNTSSKNTSSKNTSVNSFLKRHNISASLAQEVAQRSLVDEVNSHTSLLHVASTLASCFLYNNLLTGEARADANKKSVLNRRFIFFSGPVGVGKTTAIFKIASLQKQNSQQNIAVASLDCKRLMASAQLQHFCKIIEVPYRRLQGIDDLLRMEAELAQNTVCFVDLSGMVAGNTQDAHEIASYCNALTCQAQVLYFIDATRRQEDLQWQLNTLKPMPIASIAMGKVDETRCIGSAVSAAWHSGKPVSAVFYGTDVPHDYCLATSSWLEQALIKQWSY